MKFILTTLTILTFSTQAFAELITCRADKTIQQEVGVVKTDAVLSFNLDRETKTIDKVIGHIFVQGAYVENEDISVLNSYMGFFAFESLKANPNYRPHVYKGWTQFKEFDAIHTAGLESGMWGAFVLDLRATGDFLARYIFQAGDHMGGTVLFNCSAKSPVDFAAHTQFLISGIDD